MNFVPGRIWLMEHDEAARRLYSKERDKVVRRVIEYYREYVEIARKGGWWVRWRPQHDRWLTQNFGDEVAGQIKSQVRGWHSE